MSEKKHFLMQIKIKISEQFFFSQKNAFVDIFADGLNEQTGGTKGVRAEAKIIQV
jgi:hypothetical protein